MIEMNKKKMDSCRKEISLTQGSQQVMPKPLDSSMNRVSSLTNHLRLIVLPVEFWERRAKEEDAWVRPVVWLRYLYRTERSHLRIVFHKLFHIGWISVFAENMIATANTAISLLHTPLYPKIMMFLHLSLYHSKTKREERRRKENVSWLS
jgi:hypothetical protein